MSQNCPYCFTNDKWFTWFDVLSLEQNIKKTIPISCVQLVYIVYALHINYGSTFSCILEEWLMSVKRKRLHILVAFDQIL